MAQGIKRTQKAAGTSDAISVGSLPDLVGQSFASRGRANTAGYPESKHDLSVRFNNLTDCNNPYSIINECYISAQEMVNLCRNAYANVGAFRTSIDIMTDLANTPIHLEGGNAQSLDFFKAWLKRINDGHIKDEVFSELLTSGTVLLYRVDAELTPSETLKLNQNYAAETVSIPTKYILLDSANICLQGLAYDNPTYYKILNPYELDQLKRSEDENNNESYKSIKKAIDAYLKGGANKIPLIELDKNKLHTIFYQKKDYQPFPIPMGYSVLDDVNLLIELKKSDTIFAKTVEYALLLITMGAEKDKGGTDPKALEAMKGLFRNNKLGRVLISDYTTEAKFVNPELDKIMTPTKYQEVDKNIASGMMNVFFGDQKYADSITKLKILTKKIEKLQELFLREFINPEIKRISKQMNFKSFPIARMEPVRIEDQTNTQRIYAQLIQLGVLTAEDALQLFQTGLFPSYEEMLKRQDTFREARDKGNFQPIQGGPFDSMKLAEKTSELNIKEQKAAPKPVSLPGGGRPPGTKQKQTTKKVSQTGASVFGDDFTFSQKKVAENTLKMIDAKAVLEKEYKKINQIKRLSKNHKDRLDLIGEILFENESPEDWVSQSNSYLVDLASHPVNSETQAEIEDIKHEFEVDHQSGIILYHSKI